MIKTTLIPIVLMLSICTPVLATKYPEWMALINYVKLTTAKSVTVYVKAFPNSVSDENSFKENSCRFTVENPKNIGTLVQLLHRSDIENTLPKETTPSSMEGNLVILNLQTVIDFTFADGSQASFLVSRDSGTLLGKQFRSIGGQG